MPELDRAGKQIRNLAQAYGSSSLTETENTSVHFAQQDIGTQRLQAIGRAVHLHARILDDEPELSLLQLHFNVNGLKIWFTTRNGKLHNA